MALISGAASGIGAETARVLAEAGGVVVLADIDDAGGARVTGALKAAGHDAHFEHLDGVVHHDVDAAEIVADVPRDGLPILLPRRSDVA